MLIAQCTDVWVFKNTNSHKHTLVRSHTTIPFCSRRACIIWLLLFLFFSVIVSLLHCICTNAWFNLLTVGHKQDRTKPSEWADGRKTNAFDALDGWTVAQKHITSFGLDLSTMAWSRVHECQRSYHLWDWIVEEQNDWSIYCLVQFRWMTILSGTGSFPFCKISSLLSALEFFALNRILFLWLDFMSISRFLNFYLRGSLFFSLHGRNFRFLRSIRCHLVNMKVMLLLLITAFHIFRWADWCWFVEIGVVTNWTNVSSLLAFLLFFFRFVLY